MFGLIIGLAAAYGVYGSFRARAHYRALPEVVAPAPCGSEGASHNDREKAGEDAQTLISIVVPARNEAHRLPRLLTSLVQQRNARTEMIVVDDASDDGTGTIASGFGAQVLHLAESDRPPGWFGKPNACFHGARAARGDWLLFLDADVRLHPDAVCSALDYALLHRLDALSLFLQQDCRTLWERLLLPYAFQQFFAGVDPQRLSDPDTGEAMLNGQFILIRAAAYWDVGGHASVHASIVEDVALARTLKLAGKRAETVRGEQLGSVRMYHGLSSVRAGFGKNAYAFLADEPVRGAKVALTSTCASLAVPLLIGALSARGQERWRRLVLFLTVWIVQAIGMLAWLRQFRVPLGLAILHPVASLVFQSIAIESTLRRLLGLEVSWKGRAYRLAPPAPPLPGQLDHACTTNTPETSELRPRLPLSLAPSLSVALLRRRRNSLLAASSSMAQALAGRWEAEGVDRIPPTGPVCLVINHWQRPGLWIGWVGGLLGWLVAQRRPSADPPVRWLVTTEWRAPVLGRERHLFFLDAALRRVAHVWGLIPLDPHPRAVGQRAAALRSLGSSAVRGEVIGLFPEGHQGRSGRLGQPVEGVGRLVTLLVRRGVTIVPVGIHESAGRLIIRIGQPLPKDAPEGDADGRIMHAIARLLPERLRGSWSVERPDAIDRTLDRPASPKA